jgi:hypothetical protein
MPNDGPMKDDYVSPYQCPECGAIQLCDLCEFWDDITLRCRDQAELDAWIEAVRQERRKPPASRRHGKVILAELRAKRSV